jgi:hypothetical protein
MDTHLLTVYIVLKICAVITQLTEWSLILRQKLKILKYSRNYSHFLDPEGLLPYTQEFTTGPSLQPDESLHTPILFLLDPLEYHISIYSKAFLVVCFLQVFIPKHIYTSCLLHAHLNSSILLS